jgi:hypothetical protein
MEVSINLRNVIEYCVWIMTSGHSNVNENAYHIKGDFVFRDINVSTIGIFL